MKVPQIADTCGQLSDANFPKVGQIVQVRTRTYMVDDVIRSPKIVFGTLVKLVCVDDDAQGQPLEVIRELELEKKSRGALFCSKKWLVLTPLISTFSGCFLLTADTMAGAESPFARNGP
jgi:hypothetical protein